MEELKLVGRQVELQENGPEVQDDISERPRASQGRRNPPARNTSRFWFERFLAVIQRQNPSVIDSTFLSQIAPSNEGKLLAQLKFLRVIDEQGKPTGLLSALNMVGDEQKKGFQEIARGSYGDLIGEVKLERAVPDDIVNFFIRRYGFTRDKALNASRFFLYLAEKSSMPISPELSSFLLDKERSNGSSSPGSSVPSASARILERNPRTYSTSRYGAPRKAPIREQSYEPSIQATISIRLDKDTPKEYWDRAFALLGERKIANLDVVVNGPENSDVYSQDQTEKGAE